jgi:hypothetical protein
MLIIFVINEIKWSQTCWEGYEVVSYVLGMAGKQKLTMIETHEIYSGK